MAIAAAKAAEEMAVVDAVADAAADEAGTNQCRSNGLTRFFRAIHVPIQ